MTLSRWFRDYLYIPLGGNRNGTLNTYRNLILVFFLTGLWHGASWTMVIWGLFHGLFLVLERLALKNILPKLVVVNRIYTLLIVMIAWVFFKSPDIEFAWKYIGKLFGANAATSVPARALSTYLTVDFIILLITAVLCSGVIAEKCYRYFSEKESSSLLHKVWEPVSYITSLLLLLICTMYLAKQGYNPFIYFQF